MKSLVRRFAENVLPPVVFKTLQNLIDSASYSGDFRTFQEALLACGSGGMTKDNKYVEYAFESLKNYKASPVFDNNQLGLLAAFLLPLFQRTDKDRFHVLDYGGGPGISYLAMKSKLPSSVMLEWDIFETEIMASEGRKAFQADQITYFTDWKNITQRHYDVIVISTCLQFLEHPHAVLDQLTKLNCRYLIVHSLPVIAGDRDHIMVQIPPPIKFHQVHRKGNFPQFPLWFFSEKKFFGYMEAAYSVKMCWLTANAPTLSVNAPAVKHKAPALKSYLLEKR